MRSAETACPPESVLSAFGRGKLDAASAEAISRHIETCADCRQRVAGVTGDSFVGRLKQAGNAAQPARRERTYMLGESLANAANSTDGSAWGGLPRPSKSEGGLPRRSRSVADEILHDGLGRPSSQVDGLGRPPHVVTAPPELANHPDYELIKDLGQGGMGTVYLARNRMMDRPEVLKVISKALLDRPGALERFQQEIRSAAKLAHPNIVAAYQVLRLGDLLVFAMEYVAGRDLGQVVKGRGYLPVVNAALYVQQVALGLQHAFEKGMVHRDIKPNNLMLAVEGKKHVVKILDFGLARATSEKDAMPGLTQSGQMLGTPDFIAPEQILDAHKADIRADIYSLGCTLYYLLSGRAPFHATSLYEVLEAHHKCDPEPLNLVRPDVPMELAAVVGKMMAKDPAKRYQTPGEVAKALVPFFKPGQGVATSPLTDATQSRLAGGTAHGLDAPTPVSPVTPPPAPFPVPVAALPVATAVSGPLPAVEPDGQLSLSIADHRPNVRRRGRRSSWNAVAAGVAFVALLLGVTVIIRNRKGDEAARVEVPEGASVGIKPTETNSLETPDARINASPSRQSEPGPGKSATGPTDSGGSKRFACTIKQAFRDDWSIDGGELVQKSLRPGWTYIRFGETTWDNYDFSVEAMRFNGNNLFVLSFSESPTQSFFYSLGVRNARHDTGRDVGGKLTLFHKRAASLENGRWYRAEVRVRGKKCECFLDGKKQFEFTADGLGRGRFGIATMRAAFRFRNIFIKAPDGAVLLEGLPDLDGALISQGDANGQPGWRDNADSQSLPREADKELKMADYDAIATGSDGGGEDTDVASSDTDQARSSGGLAPPSKGSGPLKPIAAATTQDNDAGARFRAGSIWTSGKHSLTVNLRKGESFVATYRHQRINWLVRGTIKGNKVQWLAKDYRQAKAPTKGVGGLGHDHFGTIIKDNGTYKIGFQYRGGNDGKSGAITFYLKTAR